jgi:hypothetical protein
MNISELGTNGPPGWWVPTLSIPVSLLVLTIILGKVRYSARQEYKMLRQKDGEKGGLWDL